MNSSLRRTARRLANEGYAVFTPDLFAGQSSLVTLARLVVGAHACYDPFGPMYEPNAAADAWDRTLRFIRHQLRG